jgi:hypothetical protein
MAEDLGTPEGIDRHHIEEAHGGRLHSLPLGLLGLGVLLALSIFGFLGAESTVEGEGQRAGLRVDAPERIRNGEFFEMTFTIDAREEIENLVVTVEEAVWQDITVNTFFPAAEAESFADGSFEFEFGPIEAERRFVVKIDCQVNPDHAPSTNTGSIGISDDGEPIAAAEYTLEVLP